MKKHELSRVIQLATAVEREGCVPDPEIRNLNAALRFNPHKLLDAARAAKDLAKAKEKASPPRRYKDFQNRREKSPEKKQEVVYRPRRPRLRSRRRRGRGAGRPRTRRGDAAATTWMVRGDGVGREYPRRMPPSRTAPRRSRGVAATRFHGLSTSEPQRCRDPVPAEYLTSRVLAGTNGRSVRRSRSERRKRTRR